MSTPHQPTPAEQTPGLTTLVSILKANPQPKLLILTGAGLSTSCGLPDFRTPTSGLYAKLSPLQLPYPEALFHISYFSHTPEPFYAIAHARHPRNLAPSLGHAFLALLEQKGLLEIVVTQNIDGLEADAGVSPEKILNVHGSWKTQRCMKCKTPFGDAAMRRAIRGGEVPICEDRAGCKGIIKPDIVMFGESLPAGFGDVEKRVLPRVDLVLVMGTSLKVAPVSELPRKVGGDTPRVLINRECVEDFGARESDVVLLGGCDEVVRQIARGMGWEEELEVLHREAVDRKQRAVKEEEEGWDSDDGDAPSLDECIARAAERMKVRMGVSEGHRRMLEEHLGEKMAGMLQRRNRE
ncbi:DHS-like NAD/FAD-binding domain-containing protein [Aspergillus heterothallicus]